MMSFKPLPDYEIEREIKVSDDAPPYDELEKLEEKLDKSRNQKVLCRYKAANQEGVITERSNFCLDKKNMETLYKRSVDGMFIDMRWFVVTPKAKLSTSGEQQKTIERSEITEKEKKQHFIVGQGLQAKKV